MTKRKISDAVRAALGGAPSEPHVCVPRATLAAILEACNNAAPENAEGMFLAIEAVRALVQPYLTEAAE